ncbi:hypothetical protein Pen01_50880 [Phytomonospora endophytica]|nr:hypothetical protein Pen01_50880 [Phytomonospora endophytica]
MNETVSRKWAKPELRKESVTGALIIDKCACACGALSGSGAG